MKAATSAAPAAPVVVPLALPPGAFVLAPPPALVGTANAAHVGMTPVQLHAVLSEMARDAVHGRSVLVVSRRPKAYAAPPADVLAFLRARGGVSPVEQDEVGPESTERPRDEAEEEAERLLAEVGAKPTRDRSRPVAGRKGGPRG